MIKKWFLRLACLAMIIMPALLFAQAKVTKERIEVSIESSVRSHVEEGKINRTLAEHKMSTQVLELRAQHKLYGGTFQPKGITPQEAGKISPAQVDLKERVHLYLYIPKDKSVATVVRKLRAKGVIISASNKDVPIIQVWATIQQLDVLAKMSEVRTIDLVVPPVHSAGPVLSEGVPRMHADAAQSVMGATGTGIKVGVMSDDCGTTEGLIPPRVANGELTFNPVIIDDSWGGTRTHEGLAMMEIVQDVAPQAQLYYATAFTGYTNFVNNVQNLANAGCKVITDDIIYFNEPVFEDGALSAKIDAVAAANGVIYTSASTNAAQFTWTGTYTDHATTQNIGNTAGGPYHVCDYTGTTFLNGLTVGGGTVTITLHWDDQFGNSKNDYDLFVVNAANNVTIASSTNTQNDGSPGNPYEQCAVGAGTYNIIIRRTSTSAGDPNPNARLKLSCWQVGMSIVNPVGSTFGHPTATNAIGCGAIGSDRNSGIGGENNYNTIEGFSSQGPCKIINFGGGLVGGNRPVSVQRLKPDVASFDGVLTSVPGFQPFYGTSAAAPHTAGIAADLASLYPSITSAAAQTAIKNGCIDYGPPGPDNIYGNGRTDAFRTIALYRQSISPSVYSANYTTPGVTIPDNTPAGITSALSLSPTCNNITPSSIYVSVTVDGHNKIGDLIYTLTSPDNTTITLMNRPVSGAGNATGKNPNIVFGDAASTAIQGANPAGLEEVGFYIPANAISTAGGFGSHALGGTWTLTASDNAIGNIGILKDWGIYAVEGTSTPPTLTISWNPPFIWPNDHTLRTINVSNSLSGGCTPNIVLQSVTSNEPDFTSDPGDVPGDIQGATLGVNTLNFQLRSECLSTGKGRYYTVDYRITDVGGYQRDTVFAIPVLCTPGRVNPSTDVPFAGLTLDRTSSPDPLVSSSTISYTIPGPSSAPVLLTICNNLGKWVKNFDFGTKAAGTYTLSWNASAADGTILPNGVYAYQLSVGAPYNALKTGVVIVNHP
jgi:subtilisin-like proprotein convertase family protein